MVSVFYDHANLVIDLSDEVEAVIAREQESHGFGRDKLIAVSATLRMLRSLRSSVSIAVLGPNAQWMAHLLGELATLMGFSEVLSLFNPSTGPPDALNVSYDLIVNMGCCEIENVKIINVLLPEASATSAFFISNYTDNMRNDAIISRRSQLSTLRNIGYTPIVLSYFASFMRGVRLNNHLDSERVSPDLQDRCLFVLGHARSGSSLVFNLLNEVESVLISYEMNLQIEKNRFNIIDNFNAVNACQGRPISKGFRLPTFSPASSSIENIFSDFLKKYEFFGDKIAYGARDAFYCVHPADLVYDYIMEWFPFARFIFTLREPRSAIAAMGRMRPELSLELNIDFWLGGIIRMIDLILVSDRAAVCFHSDLVSSRVTPIENMIGHTLGDAVTIVSKGDVTTNSTATADFWSRTNNRYVVLVENMVRKFEQLAGLFDSETGLLKKGYTRGELIRIRASLEADYRGFLNLQHR